MSTEKKLVDGGTINEFLTAYLYGVHALRRGRFSASDAMGHIVDLMSAVQRTQATVGKLTSLIGNGPSKGDR